MKQNRQATILVVDDDKNNRKLLEVQLSAEDYAVRSAASGEEALASVAEKLPDLILLDIMMPGIDGFEVARQLKADARSRNIPIIMVTALDSRESRLKGLAAGAGEFLSKPVDRAELLVRVGNLLKVKEYQDFLARHNDILEEQVSARTAELLKGKLTLEHANRALAALSEVNRSLIRATGNNELLQDICDAIVRQCSYRLAWVGYVQHDESKSIKIMARAGHDKGYLDAMQLTWAETERGMGTSGRAIRSGATQLCQDIASDPQYLPWRDAALKRGYASDIALPLKNGDNTVFGILHVYSAEVNVFIPAEVALLEEIAGDLAFGVHAQQIRQKHDLALIKNQEQLVQLAFQNEEKEKRAAELGIANKELAFQNEEKEKRAAELGIANKELILQNEEKEKRAAELGIANKELAFQNEEKEKRAAELGIANKELIFQNEEKEKRAAELGIANKELAFQNEEKEKRAAELGIANKELAFQNEEKEKRAAELGIANKELAFQNEEKEKRAAELVIANKALQDNLEDTVRAMATIVEMRDPYTAGHQVRVAELAVAIARQMELPDEQVHAIYLAGVLHDLGKIQIPAEILSKPGKISDIEFSLIKTHPQAGYDILKDIHFPWPLAQIILQHHERLDGSGYPQRLKGEAILLEARILSVADIVEAMSSHRPYRLGLGIDAALDEITRCRGAQLDPVVVDACLRVIKENGFVFTK